MQIARKFVGEAPAVIVPISTPSAQAVAAATKDIPVVFSSVTDPVGAKLVTHREHPGGNVTGMSNLSPIAKHLDLVKEILPELKTLGVVHNPGEANSRTLVALLKAAAPARGITIKEAPATKSADVQAAAQSLVGRVDAIYVPTDNTVVSAFEALVQVGRQNKLPVIAGDINSVPRGAIAAWASTTPTWPADGQDGRPRAQGREAGRHSGRAGRDHRAGGQSRRGRGHGGDAAGGAGGARGHRGAMRRALAGKCGAA